MRRNEDEDITLVEQRNYRKTGKFRENRWNFGQAEKFWEIREISGEQGEVQDYKGILG